jgi:hypothetical protein
MRREQKAQPGVGHRLGEQEVVGSETGVARGVGKAFVQHQQLMQHRRAAAPMPDHEDRRLLDLGASHFAAKDERLQPAQAGVEDAKNCVDHCDIEERRVDGEPVSGQ